MAAAAPNAGDKAPPEHYDIVDRAILATARHLNRWVHSVVPAPYKGSATPGTGADPSPVPNILTLISLVIGIVAAAVVARKGPRSAAGALASPWPRGLRPGGAPTASRFWAEHRQFRGKEPLSAEQLCERPRAP